MKILILLLLTSCASYKPSNEYYTMQKHIIQGVSCPVGYYYSLSSSMCHYKAELLTDSISVKQSSAKQVKRLKKANKPFKTDCSKAIYYCGFAVKGN